MKEIAFASPNFSLIGWMVEKLDEVSEEMTGAEEMAEVLNGLLEGDYATLLMEPNGNAVTSPPSVGLHCSDLTINAKSRNVTRAGANIDLTPKEFDILYFLARNRGKVFTREQIYRAVWKDDFVRGDNNIMTFIRRLRKKIEPQPDEPRYILTVWGIGYKFTDAE